MMDDRMPAAFAKLADLKRIAAVFCLTLASAVAAAEGYPERPVTFVVPYTAGSQTDQVARLIGQALQERLGQPFLIENKAGGGGMLAAFSVARAAPTATR
jgi:tripartite-type tricarboxylate transporter receptor subunit TctC